MKHVNSRLLHHPFMPIRSNGVAQNTALQPRKLQWCETEWVSSSTLRVATTELSPTMNKNMGCSFTMRVSMVSCDREKKQRLQFVKKKRKKKEIGKFR